MWKVVARIVIWIQFAVIALASVISGGFMIIEGLNSSYYGEEELIMGIIIIVGGILLDFVVCSFMGMFIDMAFDISKIAKNTAGLRNMTQIPMNPAPMGAPMGAPVNSSPVPPVAPMPVPPVANNTADWTCQCGTVNSADSKFCASCGTPR